MTDHSQHDPALTRPDGLAAPAPGVIARVALVGADVPPWAARGVIGLAVLSAVLLVGAPMGLGVTVALLAGGLIVARVPRPLALPETDLRVAEPPVRDSWRRVWWALAAALALIPVLRAAPWVVLPALITAAALASLAATGGRRWGELGAGLGSLWARMPLGPVLAGRAAGRGVSVTGAGPAARGAVLASLLLAVFIPLLASADAAFAQILSDVSTDWNIDRPVGRIAVLALVVAGGGALIHTAVRPFRPAPIPPRATLGRLEWALPLVALVALLGGFVVFQLATLLEGERQVLGKTGLTYAEYARSGFAQLLAVAALTLAVIAAAGRWARSGGTLLHVLLGALCLLTLVVLVSALRRLGLYEEAFGFTRLRFAAHAASLYLGALFCLVLVSRGAGWLPRAVVAVTAASVLAFALADPERRIAEHNVDRYERTGKIDLDYLATLGPDAAPALARFPRLVKPVEDGGLIGFNLARR